MILRFHIKFQHRSSEISISIHCQLNVSSNSYIPHSKLLIKSQTVKCYLFCYQEIILFSLLKNSHAPFHWVKETMPPTVFFFLSWLIGDSAVNIMLNHRSFARPMFWYIHAFHSKPAMLGSSHIQAELPKKKLHSGHEKWRV